MGDTPNRDNPEADIAFIVEELFNLFLSAEQDNREHIILQSSVGGTFNARVNNAAKYLKISPDE